MIIDIHSKGDYPACVLSNFAANEFEIDGVKCGGMEGFLQALKYRNPKKQTEICALYGKAAKLAGRKKRLWRLTGRIYWQGIKIKRVSPEFDALIERAYFELSKNEIFAKALSDCKDAVLTHSIGEQNPKKTILTEREFIGQLDKIRTLCFEN